MKFYNRVQELDVLNIVFSQVKRSGKLVVLTGRRRVGKTLLGLEFVRDKKFLYFFVSKKNESLICQEFLEIIREKFDMPVIGEIRNFKDIFKLLI